MDVRVRDSNKKESGKGVHSHTAEGDCHLNGHEPCQESCRGKVPRLARGKQSSAVTLGTNGVLPEQKGVTGKAAQGERLCSDAK